jgi:indole-3-glycerol phosphate synthase
MPVFLDQLVAATRSRVDARKMQTAIVQLEREAARHIPRGFRKALLSRKAPAVAVIAELKKASPSRGLIRKDFSIDELAPELESAGAAALSVLTEEDHFQGSLANLRKASELTHLPCLRKDFIVDEFQIVEARAHRADAILLIAASLTDAELIRFNRKAEEVGVDVLCEVHDDAELERALALGFKTIGVNNRNLRTFEVTLDTALRLAERMSAIGNAGDLLRVAESGIRSHEDIVRLQQAGYQAFLIGESIMAQPHPGEALRALLFEDSVSANGAG